MQPDPPLACWFGDPQFEAMVAAVSVRPSNKAPRLVLSDWLRDRGMKLLPVGRRARRSSRFSPSSGLRTFVTCRPTSWHRRLWTPVPKWSSAWRLPSATWPPASATWPAPWRQPIWCKWRERRWNERKVVSASRWARRLVNGSPKRVADSGKP